MTTIKLGDEIHGFAGGYFGRDSYECRTVEHIGPDWVILRTESGGWEAASPQDVQHAHMSYWQRKQDYDGNWCCGKECDHCFHDGAAGVPIGQVKCCICEERK